MVPLYGNVDGYAKIGRNEVAGINLPVLSALVTLAIKACHYRSIILTLLHLPRAESCPAYLFFHPLYHSDTPFSRTCIHTDPRVSARIVHAHKVKAKFSPTKKYQFSPDTSCINEWNAVPLTSSPSPIHRVSNL